MFHWAYRFSSTHEFFQDECERLKQVFIKLKYSLRLIDSVLATHLNQVRKEKVENPSREDIVRIVLPFRD